MKQAVRKPRPTILARWDQGNGRMVYTVKSTSRRASYLVESINFVVESCTCPDHQYRHHACKHMFSVQLVEEDRRIEAEQARIKAEQAAAMAAYDVVAEASKVVANAEAELDAAMYNELATTKKVSVPPAEYDSCKQCGCRIAVGAGYCKRC